MPELPEVETIKNELAPRVIGKRINDVTILWQGMVHQPSVEEFRSQLAGRQITELTRRGKYLIFHLSDGKVLIVHLKMSGSLLIKSASDEPDKYVRAIIHLDGKALHFRDPRKFGKMWLVDDEKEVVGELGPEPLRADFTPERLAQLLVHRSAPMKALLCDQSFIAGIGNMYADETLFRARIHPLRPAKSLTRQEIKRLHHAIREVLKLGISHKGASVTNYMLPDGTLGTAHNEFQVAHRGGEPCPVCGTPIARLPIRHRGTYFCPKCQPVKFTTDNASCG